MYAVSKPFLLNLWTHDWLVAMYLAFLYIGRVCVDHVQPNFFQRKLNLRL